MVENLKLRPNSALTYKKLRIYRQNILLWSFCKVFTGLPLFCNSKYFQYLVWNTRNFISLQNRWN